MNKRQRKKEKKKRYCICCRKKYLQTWDDQYCCNGRDCGCYGKPIDPWLCKKCDHIFFYRNLRE